MLTPSDKVEVIADSISKLKLFNAEEKLIQEMEILLEEAKDEEIVYHMEQDSYIQSEVTQKDVEDMDAYWEDKIDSIIDNEIDRRRGK